MGTQPEVQRGHATINETLTGTALPEIIEINQREAYLGYSTHYQLNINAGAGHDIIATNHVYDPVIGMGRDEGVPTQLLSAWGGPGIDVFVAPNISYSGMNIQDMELMEMFFTHPSYDFGGQNESSRQPRFTQNNREIVLENEQGYSHYVGIPDGTRLVKFYDLDADMNAFVLMPDVQYGGD